MTDWDERIEVEAAGVRSSHAAHAAASTTICICDPELLTLEVADLRCPTHGLAATMREAICAQKERDRL